jgi:hypothetical protein
LTAFVELRVWPVASCTLCTSGLIFVSPTSRDVGCPVYTNLLVRLDVVAFCFSALVLRRELQFPHFEIISQDIAPLLDFGSTHGVGMVLRRKQECGWKNDLGDSRSSSAFRVRDSRDDASSPTSAEHHLTPHAIEVIDLITSSSLCSLVSPATDTLDPRSRGYSSP